MSAPLDHQMLLVLRARVAVLRAPPCAMAHESIPPDASGEPTRSDASPSGYARAGICPSAVRANHLGCSHTMARYALRDALADVGGAEADALFAELHELDQAIGILDHRRYDAETRRAQAMSTGGRDDAAAAEREIAVLVAEHHGYSARVILVRDAVLRRLDEAIARVTVKGERPV